MATKKCFTVEDMVSLKRIVAFAPSPTGNWIAYALKLWHTDIEQWQYKLFIMSTISKVHYQLDSNEKEDERSISGPLIWSKDSSLLLFLSNASGTNQLWASFVGSITTNGESNSKTIAAPHCSPFQLSFFPISISQPSWNEETNCISFCASVYNGEKSKNLLQETADRDAKPKRKGGNIRTYDSLMIRHWDTWKDEKRKHIFVAKFTYDMQIRPKVDSSTAIDVMQAGDFAEYNCECKPTFSSNGSKILATFHENVDGIHATNLQPNSNSTAWSTNFNIYSFQNPLIEGVDATKKGNKISHDSRKGIDSGAVFAPQAENCTTEMVAYLSMRRASFEADKCDIVIRIDDTKGNLSHFCITKEWDVSVSSLHWLSRSKLLAIAQQHGKKKIWCFDVPELSNSKQEADIINLNVVPSIIHADHCTNTLFTTYNNDEDYKIFFSNSNFQCPEELYCYESSLKQSKKISNFNNGHISESFFMPEVEELWFEGANEEKVHAFFMKPADMQQGKVYPLAVIVHGGPQGAMSDSFHFRWNPKIYASAGFAVLMINFHGSTGYGQAFTDSISKNWDLPFTDIMKGIDFTLNKYDFLCAELMCALGASYGGFMINWINGHTNRFKCLVNHDGIFDQFAMYFATEELWFPEWEFGGTAISNPSLYLKFSPRIHADKWKTPCLVIHGGKDYRVLETEGFSTFTALQRQGIPSKLVYFEDENHWVLHPTNSIVWHKEVLQWIEKYTKTVEVRKEL